MVYATPTHPVVGLRTRKRLTDAEAVSYVRQHVDPMRIDPRRWGFVRSWIRSLAFLNGRQYFVDDISGNLRTPQLSPHQVMYVANIIKGRVSDMVSRVMSTRASFTVTPADSSEEAVNRAHVSNKLFEHLRRTTFWKFKQQIGLTWAATCGSTFYKVCWDPDEGDLTRFYWENKQTKRAVIPLSDDERRMKEEDGLFEDMPDGDVLLDHVNPFQMHWDWRSREEGFSTSRWANQSSIVTGEALLEMFPDKRALIENITPRMPTYGSNYYEEIMAFMASGLLSPTQWYAPPSADSDENILLQEFWERPMRTNGGEGRHIVIAGDQVLANQDNKYRRAKTPIPFVKLDWRIKPGSFIGHGVVPDMISAQFQYNESQAKLIQHMRVFGSPAVFLFKDSGLPSGQWALEPGLVYDTNVPRGQKIFETGPTPTLGKEVAEVGEKRIRDLDLMSSMQPQNMPLPTQARATDAIRQVLEERNRPLQESAELALHCAEMIGRHLLCVVKAFMPGQRVMKYLGPDNAWAVQDFIAASVETDLRVTGEPEFFHSPSTARAQIVEYVQAGILNPGASREDKIDVLRALHVGSADTLIADRLADERNQREEIREMTLDPVKYVQQGGYPVGEFDDHEVHLKTIVRFIKSPKFRELDPVSRELVLVHARMHQATVQAAIEAQIKQMAETKGAAKKSGQPSAPKPQGANA